MSEEFCELDRPGAFILAEMIGAWVVHPDEVTDADRRRYRAPTSEEIEDAWHVVRACFDEAQATNSTRLFVEHIAHRLLEVEPIRGLRKVSAGAIAVEDATGAVTVHPFVGMEWPKRRPPRGRREVISVSPAP